MTSQAQAIRHPWFNNPSMKRKRPAESDSPLHLPSSSAHKRIRCSSLEGGFSHLSLNHASPVATNPTTQLPSLSAVTPMSIFEVPRSNSTTVVVQGSVEEPPSPDIPEIKMRNWYEPEKDRIVITDLDDSDSDVEKPDCDPEIIISPAALNHIKDNTAKTLSMKKPEMALVLYKPITVLGKEMENDHPETLDDVQSGDDAMDVGP